MSELYFKRLHQQHIEEQLVDRLLVLAGAITLFLLGMALAV